MQHIKNISLIVIYCQCFFSFKIFQNIANVAFNWYLVVTCLKIIYIHELFFLLLNLDLMGKREE